MSNSKVLTKTQGEKLQVKLESKKKTNVALQSNNNAAKNPMLTRGRERCLTPSSNTSLHDTTLLFLQKCLIIQRSILFLLKRSHKGLLMTGLTKNSLRYPYLMKMMVRVITRLLSGPISWIPDEMIWFEHQAYSKKSQLLKQTTGYSGISSKVWYSGEPSYCRIHL